MLSCYQLSIPSIFNMTNLNPKTKYIYSSYQIENRYSFLKYPNSTKINKGTQLSSSGLL